jgi:hypothetical protein
VTKNYQWFGSEAVGVAFMKKRVKKWRRTEARRQ